MGVLISVGLLLNMKSLHVHWIFYIMGVLDINVKCLYGRIIYIVGRLYVYKENIKKLTIQQKNRR